MVIREAKAKDWPAIWLILNEIGTAGETLTWDSTRIGAVNMFSSVMITGQPYLRS
jgi:hypothetical protein